MNNKIEFDYFARVDKGRVRLDNQDNAIILTNKYNDILLVVTDGMGGHNAGDFASKIAIDSVAEAFNKHKRRFMFLTAKFWLESIVYKTNKIVYNASLESSQYQGMGTTMVAVLIHANHLIVVNVGDSRAYCLKNNNLVRLSEDQSYVEYLKRSGQINEEEAKNRNDKNVLLSALGTNPSVNFNSKIYIYHNEDILLCSDGLYNNLEEKNILDILKKGLTATETVNNLLKAANFNGGSDNIGIAYLKRKIHD